MDKVQKEVISDIVGELIAIKYELALYMDDGLLRLGEGLDNAIDRLNQVLGTSEIESIPFSIGSKLQNHLEVKDTAEQNRPFGFQRQPATEERKGLGQTVVSDKVPPTVST